MSGKITRKFRFQNAKQFYEMFGEAQPTNLYFFIAKPTSWSNEQNPPVPLDNTETVDYNIWDSIIEAKKISPSDVSFGTKRNAWTTSTVFPVYNSSIELGDDFFVLTDEYQVYKCLENNNGGLSTTKPTGRSLTPVRTADNYLWKYMYSLTVAQALDFLTPSYTPVNTPTTDDGLDLWDVMAAAKNGGVESFRINNGGTGYATTTNTFPTTGTSTTFTLAASASAVDNLYSNSSIYIVSGTGAGQLRTVLTYNGTTKLGSVSVPFSPVPDLSSRYLISPQVVVAGTGTGASAYSVVEAGQVKQLNTVNTGINYTSANVSIVGTGGSSANVSVNISPLGGHGKNPTTELFGHNVILNVILNENDSNAMKSNDYRIAGVIADPISVSTGLVASSDSYDQTARLTISSPTGNFFPDEAVTGGTSGATGVFLEFRGDNDEIMSVIKTSNTDFTVGESVIGQTSGFSANVTAVALPELTKYTGDIIYFENNRAITRSEEQKESIKIVVKF